MPTERWNVHKNILCSKVGLQVTSDDYSAHMYSNMYDHLNILANGLKKGFFGNKRTKWKSTKYPPIDINNTMIKNKLRLYCVEYGSRQKFSTTSPALQTVSMPCTMLRRPKWYAIGKKCIPIKSQYLFLQALTGKSKRMTNQSKNIRANNYLNWYHRKILDSTNLNIAKYQALLINFHVAGKTRISL